MQVPGYPLVKNFRALLGGGMEPTMVRIEVKRQELEEGGAGAKGAG
jgi:hypothetical protein